MKQCVVGLVLLILTLAVSHPCIGQRVLLKTTSTRFAPALKSPVRGQVVKCAQEALDAYAAAITLMDEANDQVSKESVSKFKALFGGTAEVVLDFEEHIPLKLVDVHTYSDHVFSRMAAYGVQTRLVKATLVKVIEEEAFWVAIVSVEKDFYNYITSKDQVVTIGGRVQHQEIRFDIPKKDVYQAKIARISQRQPAQNPQQNRSSKANIGYASKGNRR